MLPRAAENVVVGHIRPAPCSLTTLVCMNTRCAMVLVASTICIHSRHRHPQGGKTGICHPRGDWD